MFPGTERFTPTKQEIDLAELTLMKQLSDLNTERQNQSTTPVIKFNLNTNELFDLDVNGEI